MSLNQIHRCKPYLGTFVEVTLGAELPDDELLAYSEDIYAEIERLQNLLSFHDPKSDLSQLNRKLLAVDGQSPEQFELSGELARLIGFSLDLWQKTQGSYDISVAPSLIKNGQLPNHLGLAKSQYGDSSHIRLDGNLLSADQPVCLDLGGIAKGFVVDKACELLPDHLSYSINAGGDLATNQWVGESVQLKYASWPSALKTHPMLGRCLATSGNYYRSGKSAFVHPQTRRTARLRGSVSVFAKSAMIADALTKAIILTPAYQHQNIANTFDVEVVRLNRFGFKTFH